MTTAASRDIRSKAFEIKFVVDRDLGERLREAGRRTLDPDPWATGPASDEYRTTTVYFDTGEFDVYRRRGSYSRAKYRIRRDDLSAGVASVAAFEDAGRISILSDKTIVEMKFTATMPAAFRRIVEDFALEPVRVSKYRLGIEGSIFTNEVTRW